MNDKFLRNTGCFSSIKSNKLPFSNRSFITTDALASTLKINIEMEQFIGKKYKLKTSENFDEYLKFIGVGFLSRKTANSVSPVCTLTLNEDGSYTLAMLTTFRNVIITFKLNEEFIEERADGTKVKSTMVIEGNKLIQTQVEDCGRKSKHIREFTPTTLITTTTAEGWEGICVRVYEIIE